ncbi:hypothetical protein [Paraburkholderia sp. BCC1884]|uniref:hypothetical protein n=1 Tax=Paraburkholderia sp. BCC1884 TaxID=2562668 RepID=UPI001181DC65|nr:hypothetical protein [Paraburkholderia sp. BCC1884]
MRLTYILIGAVSLLSGFAHAQAIPAVTLPFETHAAYFSREVASQTILDPQVFVHDKSAQAERHWQGIEHVAGVRNARIDDPAATDLYTARGAPLGMTAVQWFTAGGTVTLTARADGREDVTVHLHGLKPGGEFSLFENHFDQQPIGFTPVDGTGNGNSFVADSTGSASVSMVAPAQMTHANAVLVVYHSDNETHGSERGAIGETAHHQLIARVP